jgi:hypothetical protein
LGLLLGQLDADNPIENHQMISKVALDLLYAQNAPMKTLQKYKEELYNAGYLVGITFCCLSFTKSGLLTGLLAQKIFCLIILQNATSVSGERFLPLRMRTHPWRPNKYGGPRAAGSVF